MKFIELLCARLATDSEHVGANIILQESAGGRFASWLLRLTERPKTSTNFVGRAPTIIVTAQGISGIMVGRF